MAQQPQSSRRAFLSALGAGVAAAGTLAAQGEIAAQTATPLKIVDFHNHYMGPSWTLTNLASVPPAARPTWEKINGNLQSQSALLASVEIAGIAARVINTPTAFIEDADGKVPPAQRAHQRPDGRARSPSIPASFTASRPSTPSRAMKARAN